MGTDFENKVSMLVSIITPVYNAEKYLAETISSVLNQTYTNWEWILVDDCSTDKSMEILMSAAAKDSRIKIFQNTINSKAYATRNRALENSRGRYIAFLDADDCWELDKLKLQLNFMKSKEVAICYTNLTRFKETNEHPNRVSIFPPSASYKDILTNNYIATSTVMIDKRMTGSFKMRNVYYDDFTLWLELLQKIPVAYNLNLTTTNYRLSEDSLSRNKLKSAKKVYEIFTQHLGFSFIESRLLFLKWALNTTLRYLK